MLLVEGAAIMSPQSEVCMRGSWATFWRDGSDLAELFEGLAPSALQRTFLTGLTPVEAPAIGLEVSRRGLRRRPQMAALLLSRRLARWRSLLAPLLEPDGSFAGGLHLNDLTPLIHSLPGEESWFEPATWVEYTQPPRRRAGQPFLLFRSTTEPWPLARLKRRLQHLHAAFPQVLQERLRLPAAEWFAALEALPLAGLDQLGIDLSPDSGSWRFLFGVTEPERLCSKLEFSDQMASAMESCPIGLALDSRHLPADRYAIEVFPRYRQEHTITSYPGEIPADASQWPLWPAHSALLPQTRLAGLIRHSVHDPAVAFGSQTLALRGGLSHQKLVVESGELVDHKAYLGVIVAASRGNPGAVGNRSQAEPNSSAVDHAITLLANSSTWTGFDLNPGPSDRWVPLACLALLSPWRQHPRLRDVYDHQLELMRPVLDQPAPVGYSQTTPVDVDSSLWLKRCLIALDWPSSSALDRFLDEAWNPQRGVSTYPAPDQIAAYIQCPTASLKGWCAPHDCVLTNLATTPQLSHAHQALSLLRDRLRSGDFISYWWPLDGLMLSLLPRGALPRDAVERVISQQFDRLAKAKIPLTRPRLMTFSRSLMQLVHGTTEEQKHAFQELDRLITSPHSFSNLMVMQLPDPDCLDPKAQRSWLWAEGLQGSLAPDAQGCLAAALMLSAQVRSR